ncbi:MAG: hypothetical protein IT426_13110 [Pirellulales bacterium]|nr:hypothetical protein [Pirellulales bacterium]
MKRGRGYYLFAGGPAQAGVCCINIDKNVADEQIAAIFRTADELRAEMK